jgi:hypothetical protein
VCVSGITFIRYAQNRKRFESQVLGSIKPNGLNRIAKTGQGYLYLRKENLSFINNYII